MNIPPPIPKVIPGRPIPRRALNRMAEAASEAARTWLSSGLSIIRMAGIPLWKSNRDRRTFARLSGPASPYSATLVIPKADGLWEPTGPAVTLDAQVYADNDEAGMDGKVVEIFRTGGDWWRFPCPRLGAAHPPPACPLTVRLLTCDGEPIEGATVTIRDFPARTPPRTPIVGETDADGKYTFPPNTPIADGGISNMNSYTIDWDGASFQVNSIPTPSVHFCETTLDHCYDKAKVTVSTTGAASPDLSFTPGGFVKTGGGTGTIELTHKRIRYCSSPSLLPATLDLQVVPASTAVYLNNCATAVVDCNEEIDESIPLFKWDDDYAVASPLCDKGCEANGGGPNFRGLIPKHLFVTPTTLAGLGLGAYEGAVIPVDWDGVSSWDSGCLPPPGVHCFPGTPYTPLYQSARMQIFRAAGGSLTFVLTLFASGDCTPGASPFTCPDYKVTSGIPGSVCLPYFYAPLDVNTPGNPNLGFGSYNFHITE